MTKTPTKDVLILGGLDADSNGLVDILEQDEEDEDSTLDLSISAAESPTNTIAVNTYRATVDINDTEDVGGANINDPGLFNIFVEATDVRGNLGNTGHEFDSTDSTAVTIELDPVLNGGFEPGFTVAGKDIFEERLLRSDGEKSGDEAEIEVVVPLLITVAFDRECDSFSSGTGLPLAGDTGCRDGGEEEEYSGDTHRTVEILSSGIEVVLEDGTILNLREGADYNLSSSDNIVYTMSLLNPPIGKYTVVVTAKDEAKRVSRTIDSTIPELLESEFVIIPSLPVELEMKPGWNLISLPFQPINPSINSVLPPDHAASLVMSYDNATGLWSVSRRDPDTGLFTGDVRTMVATTAYFVFTATQQDIRLIRPDLATAAAAPAVPPAVPVVAGWNLVPVLSNETPLPGQPGPKETKRTVEGGISADEYFGTLRTTTGDEAWLKALLWNTETQTWISIAPNATYSLAVGGTNRCTNEDLDPLAVADGTEPCLQTHNDRFPVGSPNGIFDGTDTATMQQILPIGAGVWVWSTIDGVIIP